MPEVDFQNFGVTFTKIASEVTISIKKSSKNLIFLQIRNSKKIVLGIEKLQKLIIKPGTQLASWLLSEEGRTCVDDVRNKANIRTVGQAISMWHMEIDESDIHNPQVVVFGDEQCRKRAGMQLEIHFKLNKKFTILEKKLTNLSKSH